MSHVNKNSGLSPHPPSLPPHGPLHRTGPLALHSALPSHLPISWALCCSITHRNQGQGDRHPFPAVPPTRLVLLSPHDERDPQLRHLALSELCTSHVQPWDQGVARPWGRRSPAAALGSHLESPPPKSEGRGLGGGPKRVGKRGWPPESVAAVGTASKAVGGDQESFLEEGCPELTLGGGQACAWPKKRVRDSPDPRWTLAAHSQAQRVFASRGLPGHLLWEPQRGPAL